MTPSTSEPWYKDGLAFSCTRCGACCTGEPGFVWVTEEELTELAATLGEPIDEVRGRFTRKSRGRITLREKANGDCVFFDPRNGCTGYRARPRQCRTWPFWESNVASPETWEATTHVCPGAGNGDLIPAEEITRRVKVIKI
jgi:Fe-S-cluster containining protein